MFGKLYDGERSKVSNTPSKPHYLFREEEMSFPDVIDTNNFLVDP
jgi:hypothetical protein